MRKLLKSVGISITCLLATSVIAQAQISTIANPALNERINFGEFGSPVSGSVDIVSGKSKVLQFDRVVGHSLVANPDIVDIVPMTDKRLYLLGKDKGTTSLTLFDGSKNLLGVFDLNVSHDVGGLKRNLYELAANENIQVRSNNDGLILSGTVSSPHVAMVASALAEQVAPGKVINALENAAPHQVMLSVRIAEVQRSVSKSLGLKYNTFFENLRDLSFLNGTANPESFASGILNYSSGNYDFSINTALDALEEKGVLTTLAEPTLVAVSGEKASFLAGGEFPVPVASDAGENGVTITIEFKEFGVKLGYTPTVIGDTINLVIEPEVSVLDPQNGIILNNIRIPALITRRANTTVDLKNGQSFAIAGLLQEVFQDDVSQIPGLGSIPIIGALARSSSYQKKETELMIIVTPYLVEPIESELMDPTDFYQRPNEAEIFLMGKTEGAAGNSSGYAVR